MARSRGSVRMGPVSLFTLIIILCLAVMAVLSVTTAQATYSFTQRQAAATADGYLNERAAQELVAGVDAELAGVRAAGGGQEAAVAAVEAALPELADGIAAEASAGTGDAAGSGTGTSAGATGGAGSAAAAGRSITVTFSVADAAVQAHFATASGRCLDIELSIRDDATYQIEAWKATTLWNDEAAGETLWSGSANPS